MLILTCLHMSDGCAAACPACDVKGAPVADASQTGITQLQAAKESPYNYGTAVRLPGQGRHCHVVSLQGCAVSLTSALESCGQLQP